MNLLQKFALLSCFSNSSPSLARGFVWGLALSALCSCSAQPQSVTLSSGIAGGYYSRLGQQIGSSATKTVGLGVHNLDSQGSRQNLQRLLERQVDFALVQLDVASQSMRLGQVQAVVILANEYIHVITQADSNLKTFADLQGKRVAIGTAGSGIRFTASQLIKAAGLSIRSDASGFDLALKKLKNRQVDAVIYVGSLGASEKLREQIAMNHALRIVQIQPSLVNYVTLREPGSYQPATIRIGTYNPSPAIPAADVPTLSTATVLATRPDVSRQKVGLLTWSILYTSRKYSQFYPELESGDARSLLQRGLFYMHPAAQEVFDQGDPRDAWLRYWQNNSDLQAGIFLLVGTSAAGLLLQRWRSVRSQKLVRTTLKRINELKALLPHNAQQALKGIEELSQEHRLRFIDGAVTTEVYEQVQQKTQMFAEQCRTLLDQQRKQFVLDTLLLLDEWQATLQTNPEAALEKLSQFKQQYREMLLSDQVDIQAYIELMELTLISIMTLVPKASSTKRFLYKRSNTIF